MYMVPAGRSPAHDYEQSESGLIEKRQVASESEVSE